MLFEEGNIKDRLQIKAEPFLQPRWAEAQTPAAQVGKSSNATLGEFQAQNRLLLLAGRQSVLEIQPESPRQKIKYC